ncbi:MAG: MurT ligase domain-containing protein [Cyanobacteria bacterium]|nr:MurT ligase domain-containing protein [Cyanobacteriota bacterium]
MMLTRLAVLLSKGLAGLIRLSGRGAGTSLPGKLLLGLNPRILEAMSQSWQQASNGVKPSKPVIAITGTNGKTTTSGLMSALLSVLKPPICVINNHLGANMLGGIATALALQTNTWGEITADAAVLEVDEASLRAVMDQMPAQSIVVTNLFRDQLDRYGELDTTARMILDGIDSAKPKTLYLNADDPLVTHLGAGSKLGGHDSFSVKTFGIDHVYYGENDSRPENSPDNSNTLASLVPFPREVTTCPRCAEQTDLSGNSALHYQQIHFGHLGHYHCPRCGFSRPQPDVCAAQVTLYPDRSLVTLQWYQADTIEIELPLPGLFNVYNLLAALAPLKELLELSPLGHSLDWPACQKALTDYQTVFGRAEHLTLRDKAGQGKSVMVMLIKNPVGASEVLKLVASDPNGQLCVVLNDNYADGRDVSWIWDAQFESLSNAQKSNTQKRPIWVSGTRAGDMATRLKYAGLDPVMLTIETDPIQAVMGAVEKMDSGQTLYVLPTYTALLTLRPFFEGQKH